MYVLKRKLRFEALERRQMLAASIRAVGDVFHVNAVTDDYQEQAATAIGADGASVVVWSSHHGDGGIFAKLLAADGSVAKDEFLISNVTDGTQVYPDVAIDPASGSFVVAWQHDSPLDSQATGQSDIFARAFAADGTAVGDQVQVSGTDGDHYSPSIAFVETGVYVVSWDSFSDFSGSNVLARRFRSTNATDGSSFEISTGASEFSPAVGSAADGSFVVAWKSTDADGSGIVAHRFQSDGTPSGDPIPVNINADGDQSAPAIAVAADGSFAVAWCSQVDTTARILAQRFQADGDPAGGEIRIDQSGDAVALPPSIVILESGGLLVAWTEDSGGEGARNAVAREFDVAGSPKGNAFELSNTTDGDQQSPDVALAGNFGISVWAGDGAAGDGLDIFARLLYQQIAPVVSTGGPYTIDAGAPLPVDASGTTGREPLTYDWDFNSDGTPDWTTGSAADTVPWMTLAHLDISPGTHTITLTVSDDASNSSVQTTELTISDTFVFQPPSDGSPDDYRLLLSGNQLEIRESGASDTLLSKVLRDGINRVEITGSADDDSFTVDHTGGDPVPGEGLTFHGGGGYDAYRLGGDGQVLDLPNVPAGDLLAIEEIDLTGTGGNTLVLDAASVLQAAGSGVLTVRGDHDDRAQLGGGWTLTDSLFVGPDFFNVLAQAGATVRLALHPWQNPVYALDVSNDGFIEPLDVLQIINRINRVGTGPMPVPPVSPDVPAPFVDVTGDDRLEPLDVLRVINYINQYGSGPIPTVAAGQGEAVPFQRAVSDRRIPEGEGPQNDIDFASPMPRTVRDFKENPYPDDTEYPIEWLELDDALDAIADDITRALHA